MSASRLKSLWSRYSTTIVMVPSLIALHYGWNMMQQNRSLVSQEEQIDLPVVTFAKYCWRTIQGKEKPENGTTNQSDISSTSPK